MNKEIQTAWKLCEKINYSIPIAGTFGNPEKGDFGMVDLDHANHIAYIAFRGSYDFHDWLSNFYQKVNDHGYHWGFYKAAEGFLSEYSIIPTGYKIKLQGHSRGGALALITAALLLQNNPNLAGKIDVITFGCPKVCVKNSFLYNSIIEGRISHRYITNGMDLVPRLPFQFPWKRGDADEYYVRVGSEILVGKRPNQWEKIKMYSNIYWAFKKKNFSGLELKYGEDHQPRNYYTQMKLAKLI